MRAPACFMGFFSLALACLPFTAGARTLQVTHSPAVEPEYGSIAQAYAVAGEGDIIEIADNSAPFTENVVLGKASLTLRGRSGLSPKPVIQGTGEALGWALTAASPGTVAQDLELRAGTWGTAQVIAGGLTLLRCTADATQAQGALAPFNVYAATPALALCLEDSEVLKGANWGLLIAAADCEVTLSRTRVREVTGEAGIKLTGASRLTLDRCTVADNAQTQIMVEKTANPAQTQQIDMRHTMLITGAPAANTNPLFQYYSGPAASTSNLILNVENCDWVGSAATNFGLLCVSGAHMSAGISQSIFYRMSVAYYQALAEDAAAITEDYCAYQLASNESLGNLGGAAGAYSINMDSSAALYADLEAGDYRLLPESLAAAINPSAAQPYAGSQGVWGQDSGAAPHAWELLE